MRPEKAKRNVRNAIKLSLSNGDTAPIKDALPSIMKLLGCFEEDEREWAYCLDYLDASYHELMYISDRFNAPHRLLFLLRIAKRGNTTFEKEQR